VIAGDRDPWVPFGVQRALAAEIPDARFVVVEGCGHFVPLERPDAVTRTLIEWLGLA
jgi:pimeloyl-ACP methyl ester carboxylesterase